MDKKDQRQADSMKVAIMKTAKLDIFYNSL